MSKPADRTALQLERFINASPARVFEAWTDPQQLKQWFGPDWVQTCEIVAEAKVGGKFRWNLITGNGGKKTIAGEYRELIPAQRIVFTWKHENDRGWKNRTSIVTVELSDHDGGTHLRLTHVQLPDEESRDDHNKGWKSALDRLEKFVNS